MGGKSAAPAVPDYTGAAIAQGELGLQNTVAQSQLNNPNSITPYGSITYGGSPSYSSAPTNYSPAVGNTASSYASPATSGSFSAPTFANASTGGGVTNSGSTGLTIGGGGGSSAAPFNPLEPGVALSHDGTVGQLLSYADPIGSTLGGKGKGAGTPSAPSYNLGALGSNNSDYRNTAQVSLAPAQQSLLNSQEINQNAAGLAGTNVAGSLLNNTTGQLDLSSLPSVTQGADQINNNVVNALYNQQKQYLDPQFAQQQNSLNASLVAQGLGPLGTSTNEAANNAQTNFANEKQQAYSNALDNAQQQGTQAGYVASQENLAGAQQGLNEQEAQQQFPLQTLSQLLGISQPTLPTGVQSASSSYAEPANLTSAAQSAYQSALGNVNANNANAASTTSGLASLAGIAALLAAA